MIYIAGGVGDLPVELWEFNSSTNNFNIYLTSKYKTYYMASYPELMVVDGDW